MEDELERINRNQVHSETDPFTERRYRQFARHLRRTTTGCALDVGCNTGRGGRAFAAAAPGWVLDGVELLPERITQVPLGTYRTVHHGLLEDVPDSAGPYDALLMGELIEHVPLAAIDPLIARVTSLLRPGGHLLLTTPNPHYVLLRRRAGGTVLGGAHVSVWCPTALRQYLEWKGLHVDVVTGSGQVSGVLGSRFPLALYGSYLLVARKPR
ncbi:class I SAM-dependent methyltransferase [Mycobacterium sp.]|uniref:class I SAM-dependent methyltransferase n=1 Tax=Mycobacterium sp. TaxID=1785 RepID=UPI002BE4B0F5|nr:methyltransferase domain-containing protein [Mycobacterium sp.]HTQ21893.1 methyltransferase domain-containing protein [Mycobacterium sp.]